MRFKTNLENVPTFCALHFLDGYFCGMHYALGSSDNSQLFCSKQLNRLEGCFFGEAHGNEVPNNFSTTAIGLMPNFFNLNLALQKAGATKLRSWPLTTKFTNLVREFISRLDWSEIEQLRVEDGLGTFWTD